MSNMYKTQEKSESDEDISDSDSDTDDGLKQPKMSSVFISHKGCVNRVRVCILQICQIPMTISFKPILLCC